MRILAECLNPTGLVVVKLISLKVSISSLRTTWLYTPAAVASSSTPVHSQEDSIQQTVMWTHLIRQTMLDVKSQPLRAPPMALASTQSKAVFTLLSGLHLTSASISSPGPKFLLTLTAITPTPALGVPLSRSSRATAILTPTFRISRLSVLRHVISFEQKHWRRPGYRYKFLWWLNRQHLVLRLMCL